MNTTILQIPMAKSLKRSAQEVANEYGFSRRELVASIETPVYLSKKNERRYVKMNQDFIKSTNVKDFSSVKDLMKDLKS